MEKITVVCCCNNKEILETMLIPGLEIQKDVEIERQIYINQFRSASESYNYAVQTLKTEYVVFIHQDLRLLDEFFLAKLINNIKEDKNSIYGLCGAKKRGKKVEILSNVYHGLQNKYLGTQIKQPVEVDGLDEVFLACHKDIFAKISFDENVFDGWHLFAEDLCLQSKLNGINIKVLPYYSQHKNVLEMPKYMMVYKLYPDDYFIYLKRIRKKYNGKIDYIVCPCIVISTSFLSFYKRFFIISSKMKIFRIIRSFTMR